MPHTLVLPRTHAPALPAQGCWSVRDWGFLAHALWMPRALAEHDETRLQLIPYLVLRRDPDRVWAYQRTGGDARLAGRCSIGVGGHVDTADAASPGAAGPAPSPQDRPNCSQNESALGNLEKRHGPISPQAIEATLQHALWRELAEELAASPDDLIDLRLHGLIFEGHSAVGRVHLGLLYSARWQPAAPPQPVAGEALLGLDFVSVHAAACDTAFELWSRLAAQFLSCTQV
ncbi:MAG: hypothetical protein OHK0048_21620 [Rhodoferax sp.]